MLKKRTVSGQTAPNHPAAEDERAAVLGEGSRIASIDQFRGFAMLWAFSQRSMTMAYPILAAGLSILTFLGFYWIADVQKIKIPHLSILGWNPLVIYILQQILIIIYGDYLPKAAPLWQALIGFALIYAICYLVARYLARHQLIIKI